DHCKPDVAGAGKSEFSFLGAKLLLGGKTLPGESTVVAVCCSDSVATICAISCATSVYNEWLVLNSYI
ncbi:MAG: hypothetical protein DCC75_09485, partial [Proteobacteria bacterium]